LIAQSDLFAGGSVRLPVRAGWREDFDAELLAFPGLIKRPAALGVDGVLAGEGLPPTNGYW
jgi:hypothetical protein